MWVLDRVYWFQVPKRRVLPERGPEDARQLVQRSWRSSDARNNMRVQLRVGLLGLKVQPRALRWPHKQRLLQWRHANDTNSFKRW